MPDINAAHRQQSGDQEYRPLGHDVVDDLPGSYFGAVGDPQQELSSLHCHSANGNELKLVP